MADDKKLGQELTTTNEPSLLNIIAEAMGKPDFNIDLMERLLAAQKEIKADEAKQAYIAAMLEFHKDPPVIVKRKEGNNCKYAPLDDSIKIIRPALLAVGITPTWRTKTVTLDNGKRETEVTCILSHVLGYETESSLSGGPEDSGSKNAVQGVGSTVKYFERYTIEAACGLVAEGEDTDGVVRDTPPETITAAEAAHIQNILEEKSVPETDFLRAVKLPSVMELKSRDYDRAVSWIEKRSARDANNS